MPLELEDDWTTKVAWEADDGASDEGEILDTDDSNDSAGDGDVDEDEGTGLTVVAIVVAMDVTEDSDWSGTRSAVVVVEGEGDEDSAPGEVAGEVNISTEYGDLRTSLLGVVADGVGTAESVRVALALPLAIVAGGEGEASLGAVEMSGLDSGALPDLLRRRRRSVDEWRVSVDSSCGARFRFDLRLADLSRSTNLLAPTPPLPLLLTGLNAGPRSFPIRGFLIPDFMVEVRIRGEGGESKLLPISMMESKSGGRRSDGMLLPLEIPPPTTVVSSPLAGSVAVVGIRCIKPSSPPLIAVIVVVVVMAMGSGLLLGLVGGAFPFSRSVPLLAFGVGLVLPFGAIRPPLLLRLMSAILLMVSVVSLSFCFILTAVIVGTSLALVAD